MTSLLQDRRHRRIRHEALPPLRIPIKQHPHPILLIGIAEHLRSLRPMLPTLVRALRREDPLKLVEILDLRRRQHHRHQALHRRFSAPLLDTDSAATLLLSPPPRRRIGAHLKLLLGYAPATPHVNRRITAVPYLSRWAGTADCTGRPRAARPDRHNATGPQARAAGDLRCGPRTRCPYTAGYDDGVPDASCRNGARHDPDRPAGHAGPRRGGTSYVDADHAAGTQRVDLPGDLGEAAANPPKAA